jgi:hypothetical protein
MITVNRTKDSINVFCQGKDYVVPFSEENLKALNKISDKSEEVESIEDLHTLIEEVVFMVQNTSSKFLQEECGLYKDPKTGYYHVTNSKGSIIKTPIMPKLANRIVESHGKGESTDYLVKFFLRFARNPKFSSSSFRSYVDNYMAMTYVRPDVVKELLEEGYNESIARERATVNQVKITKEGLVNCYKVSREVDWKFVASEDGESVERKSLYGKSFDPLTGKVTGDERDSIAIESRTFYPAIMGVEGGDPFYCEGGQGPGTLGHIIKVGSNHRLDSWSQVDCRDGRSCVKGLHVGGLDYIAYITGDIHNVFVDPMYIGAIADDETGAMRVKEYFVHSSFVGVTSGMYHSSIYAAKSDKEWESMKDELVNAKKQEVKDIKEID